MLREIFGLRGGTFFLLVGAEASARAIGPDEALMSMSELVGLALKMEMVGMTDGVVAAVAFFSSSKAFLSPLRDFFLTEILRF